MHEKSIFSYLHIQQNRLTFYDIFITPFNNESYHVLHNLQKVQYYEPVFTFYLCKTRTCRSELHSVPHHQTRQSYS